MPSILDWKTAENPNALVDAAVRELAAGRLVVFPTETVYGLAANPQDPSAVEQLYLEKGRPVEKPLALAVRDAADALAWVPGMSTLGRRLARRCWPGPVTLVFSEGFRDGPWSQLNELVRQRLAPAGTLGLRVPDHDAILETMRRLPGPLCLTSANRSGQPAATTAGDAALAVGENAALVLDDGACRYGRASTVVRIDGDRWHVLREGVVSRAEIERLSARVIVFVCTGNTCRSPMAEGLCKKLLAARLGCPPNRLPERGFHVLSAGLAAMMDGAAAAEAVRAAGELGADLGEHRSRPLTAELLAGADDLIAMTRSHATAIEPYVPEPGPRLRLLSPTGDDLPDPIGMDQEVYRACARQIVSHLEPLVAELTADAWTPPTPTGDDANSDKP